MVHIKAIIVFCATTHALTQMPKFAGSSSASSHSPMPTILRSILQDAAKGAKKNMEYLFTHEKANPKTLLKNSLFLKNPTTKKYS